MKWKKIDSPLFRNILLIIWTPFLCFVFYFLFLNNNFWGIKRALFGSVVAFAFAAFISFFVSGFLALLVHTIIEKLK